MQPWPSLRKFAILVLASSLKLCGCKISGMAKLFSFLLKEIVPFDYKINALLPWRLKFKYSVWSRSWSCSLSGHGHWSWILIMITVTVKVIAIVMVMVKNPQESGSWNSKFAMFATTVWPSEKTFSSLCFRHSLYHQIWEPLSVYHSLTVHCKCK